MTHDGPKYGYFSEPEKCDYICKAEDEQVAKEVFEHYCLVINYTRGRRYLSGFIGSEATKEQWLAEMVEKWVTAVQTFLQIAADFHRLSILGSPSASKTSPSMCSVWLLTLSHFLRLSRGQSEMISFLPSSKSLDADVSVKKGGLALRNRVDTASDVHEASKSATSHLTDSLVDASVIFDSRTHHERAEYFLQKARKQRLEREQDFLDARAKGAPAVKRRDLSNNRSRWRKLITNNPASDDDEQPSATTERGNTSCHGFWKHGHTCIFDARITDTDVHSQWNKDVSKIWPSMRRKRRKSTFAYVVKCGRTLRPWSTLLTVLQEKKPRMRRSALQPSFWTNGNGHTLRWCNM
ncbi:hypothetical protein ACHAXR_011676 [Thalassiosira sp. AJA248-18]